MHHGRAEAHRFDHGQPEALGQAGEHEDRCAVVGHSEVGVVDPAEHLEAVRPEADPLRGLDHVDITPTVRSRNDQRDIGCVGVSHRADQVLEALAGFEGPDRQHVPGRQAEPLGAEVVVDGEAETTARRPTDDSQAVVEAVHLVEGGSHGVRGDDDGVRVLPGSLDHGLVEVHASRRECLRVCPRTVSCTVTTVWCPGSRKRLCLTSGARTLGACTMPCPARRARPVCQASASSRRGIARRSRSASPGSSICRCSTSAREEAATMPSTSQPAGAVAISCRVSSSV